jgi:hypothetical protein
MIEVTIPMFRFVAELLRRVLQDPSTTAQFNDKSQRRALLRGFLFS